MKGRMRMGRRGIGVLVIMALAVTLVLALGSGAALATGSKGAVYTQTNAADMNQVAAFDRQSDGTLVLQGMFDTGGQGGLGDHPQGAVILSQNNRWLFCVNAGSNDISVFRVVPHGLVLVDRESSGGTLPISLAIHGNVLYALNAGDPGNITGFRVRWNGRLVPIPGSTRPLSGSGTNPAQISFNPQGNVLVVTERATNMIDTYKVSFWGRAGMPTTHASNGAVPYGFAFAQVGAGAKYIWGARFLQRTSVLIVSEAPDSAASSYLVAPWRFSLVSGSVPDGQGAACWVAVTPNSKFAYIGNGAGPISSYRVHSSGAISLLQSAAGNTPTGNSLDLAVSDDGRMLYGLAVGAEDAIGVYRIAPNGSLTELSPIIGLPGTATGLAAW